MQFEMNYIYVRGSRIVNFDPVEADGEWHMDSSTTRLNFPIYWNNSVLVF